MASEIEVTFLEDGRAVVVVTREGATARAYVDEPGAEETFVESARYQAVVQQCEEMINVELGRI